jgi:beta-lactam-binding protein with PASTA domain
MHRFVNLWRRLLDVLRRHPRFLISIGSLVLFFLLMNYVVMPWYVNHGSRLAVPSVVGLPLDEARRTLRTTGLEPVEAEIRPDPNHPAGTVVTQNPNGGAIVKEGRRVYLTVSGGEVRVTVPLVRGRSLRDAKFALERFGLALGGVSEQNSEVFPEGTIIQQMPPADTRVARGTRVSLVVSKGSLREDTTIPQLAGKSLRDAEKLLEQAGLRVGHITYQPNFELLPNTVVDQFPRAGEAARYGDAVDLFVVQVDAVREEKPSEG